MGARMMPHFEKSLNQPLLLRGWVVVQVVENDMPVTHGL
jgi:hypothetical protein